MEPNFGIALITALLAAWSLYWQRRQAVPRKEAPAELTDTTPQTTETDLDTVPDCGTTLGAYNLDLDPMVAGPSREWNEAWSNVRRGQKQPVRFRPSAKGSRGTYRGYHSERY